MLNFKLRLKMFKQPRAVGKVYIYGPDLVTKRSDLPVGSMVTLSRAPACKGDLTVMVKDDAGKEFRILWSDLRL